MTLLNNRPKKFKAGDILARYWRESGMGGRDYWDILIYLGPTKDDSRKSYVLEITDKNQIEDYGNISRYANSFLLEYTAVE